VRGAAADDACPELRAVVAVGLPAVRVEREHARVEQVVGPAAGVVRAVIRARFDQADLERGILAQPRGQDAAGRASAGDEHVEVASAHVGGLYAALHAAPRRS
jgi:hypothetical protein